MTVSAAELYRYRLPLTEPLRLGGAMIASRRGLMLRLETSDGAGEWGEAAPLPGFSVETMSEATTAMEMLARTVVGKTVPEEADLETLLRTSSFYEGPPSVQFAFESALIGLAADSVNEWVPSFVGGTDPVIPLNALLTGREDDLREAAAHVRRMGYEAVKVKVGRVDRETDARRVRTVCHAVGSDVRVRLDANRAWTLKEALSFAEMIEDLPIEYIEEPLRTAGELREFVTSTEVPVALDETTREGGPEILDGLPVRAVILKPTLLGGVRAVRRWVRAANRSDVVPVISAAYESGVGLRMLALLAGLVSDAPAGLSTYARLERDLLVPRPALNGPHVVLDQAFKAKVDYSLLDRVDVNP